METLRYTGLLAIFFCFFFVVLPPIFLGLKSRSQTISIFIQTNKSLKKLVELGLILGALSQGLFFYFVYIRFSIPLVSFDFFLALSTILATIICALANPTSKSFIEQSKYFNIHGISALYYFIFSPISLLLIELRLGFSWRMIIPIFYFIILFVMIKNGLGKNRLLEIDRWGNTLMEIWVFIPLAIWTVIMTFFI